MLRLTLLPTRNGLENHHSGPEGKPLCVIWQIYGSYKEPINVV